MLEQIDSLTASDRQVLMEMTYAIVYNDAIKLLDDPDLLKSVRRKKLTEEALRFAGAAAERPGPARRHGGELRAGRRDRADR